MATRDLSPNAAPPPTSVNVQRASFRRRLVLSITPAVILALAALALIAWGAVRIALQRSAIDVLTAEAEEVVAELRLTPDSLHATGHSWAEPHHRLAIPRVDPVFVQIFASQNRLLRQSTNIDSLSGAYPDRLLAAQTPYDWIPSLRTITVDDRRLYYFVRPIRDAQGTRRGYIQVARDTPDHRAFVHTFGFSLLGLWLFLSAGFIGLVAWTATRVLRPLQQITTDARTISSDHLETRVTVPDAADRETALLAQALNGLLERIEQYVEALRSFTSHAAHELQTPLAVLQGHIEISLRKERDADSYRSTLRLLEIGRAHV